MTLVSVWANRKEFSLEEQEALAAARWPREWAAAKAATGKRAGSRRRNLRLGAVEAQRCEPLRAAGASCLTCKSLLRNPAGLTGTFCAQESDHNGYAQTAPDALCSWFEKRASE